MKVQKLQTTLFASNKTRADQLRWKVVPSIVETYQEWKEQAMYNQFDDNYNGYNRFDFPQNNFGDYEAQRRQEQENLWRQEEDRRRINNMAYRAIAPRWLLFRRGVEQGHTSRLRLISWLGTPCRLD